MKVSNVAPSVSFGRAFTTKEQREYEKVQAQARQELNLDKTAATIFDFSVPSSKNDTGIGTTFSKDAQLLAGFLKSLCGVNAIQLQPQGEISNYVRSPYSSTGFSLGMHIIDLNKLQDDNYGNLLSSQDLNCSYTNRVKDHDSVNYDNVFAPDGQRAMLKKAYKNFQGLDSSSPLKKEFKKFQKENAYWLERDALFEAAAVANGSKDMRTWSYRDQNVYATKDGDTARIAELRSVRDEDGDNVVDFEEFVQFIADKQQQEAKKEFNKKGIDVYGDCQIGFSQKDVWTHKSAFYDNYEFGCELGGGKITCWSPAINFDKINGEAGELVYQKFNLFFKRYNGARVDAAWQLMKPLIAEPYKNGDGSDVFDNNGNKLGRKIDHQPNVPNNGQYIIKNIILKAAANNKVSSDKVFLELLGGNSYDSLDAVKGLGTTLIHITRYAGDDWGRVKHYEKSGSNKYQNMRPGDYIIGPGTHDDDSLIQQTKDNPSRARLLAQDLRLNQGELERSHKKLSDAVFAELFTTKNQFATLPDILGSERRINQPNVTAGNWSYRAAQEYEKQYFENLAQGQGLNTPDALSKAIKAKHGGHANGLTDKLDRFASILREKGPFTREEADRVYA